ncbi:MAG: hypothetical protein HFE04_03205 [Bacilli bacterium]|nr:hypothetical protein [Bacilli bacterium]
MKLSKIIKKLTATKELKKAIKYIEKNNTELNLTKYEEILEEIKDYIKPTVKKIKIANIKTLESIPKEINLETVEIINPINLEDLKTLNKMNVKTVICTNIKITQEEGFQNEFISIIDTNHIKFKYKNINGEIINYTKDIPPKTIQIKKRDLDHSTIINYLKSDEHTEINYEFIEGKIKITKTDENTVKVSIITKDISIAAKLLEKIKEEYKIEELEIEILSKEFNEKPYIKLKENYELIKNYSKTISIKYVEYNEVSRIIKNEEEINAFIKVNSLEEIIEFYELIPNLKNYEIDLSRVNKYIEEFNYTELKNINQKTKLTFKYGPDSSYTINLKELIDLRNSIMWFRSFINDPDLSPCEKLMYAYDIVKTFKYKLSKNDENDKLVSRSPHLILDPNNDCIVCVGYASILEEITNFIDPGLSITSTSSHIDGEPNDLHARNIVRIDDEKYNIHGIFTLDATYDSEIIDEEVRKLLGSNYTSLDLYIYFMIPLKKYNDMIGENDSTYVLDLLKKANEIETFNIEHLKNDLAKYKIKLFNKDIKNEEITKYLNTPNIQIETFCEMIKNVRIKQGFTIEEVDKEIERIKAINIMEYNRQHNKNESIENSKTK